MFKSIFLIPGSHGLWSAPGKHRYVRVPRLFDINGKKIINVLKYRKTKLIFRQDLDSPGSLGEMLRSSTMKVHQEVLKIQ